MAVRLDPFKNIIAVHWASVTEPATPEVTGSGSSSGGGSGSGGGTSDTEESEPLTLTATETEYVVTFTAGAYSYNPAPGNTETGFATGPVRGMGAPGGAGIEGSGLLSPNIRLTLVWNWITDESTGGGGGPTAFLSFQFTGVPSGTGLSELIGKVLYMDGVPISYPMVAFPASPIPYDLPHGDPPFGDPVTQRPASNAGSTDVDGPPSSQNFAGGDYDRDGDDVIGLPGVHILDISGTHTLWLGDPPTEYPSPTDATE